MQDGGFQGAWKSDESKTGNSSEFRCFNGSQSPNRYDIIY